MFIAAQFRRTSGAFGTAAPPCRARHRSRRKSLQPAPGRGSGNGATGGDPWWRPRAAIHQPDDEIVHVITRLPVSRRAEVIGRTGRDVGERTGRRPSAPARASRRSDARRRKRGEALRREHRTTRAARALWAQAPPAAISGASESSDGVVMADSAYIGAERADHDFARFHGEARHQRDGDRQLKPIGPAPPRARVELAGEAVGDRGFGGARRRRGPRRALTGSPHQRDERCRRALDEDHRAPPQAGMPTLRRLGQRDRPAVPAAAARGVSLRDSRCSTNATAIAASTPAAYSPNSTSPAARASPATRCAG